MSEAIGHVDPRPESLVVTISVSSIKRRVVLLLAGLTYYLILVASYLLTIVPTHFYEGFIFRPLPPWCWAASVTLALIPLIWMSVDFRRPSDYTSWLLYACVT